ncbi:hypothetical protein DENSPDRAFT_568408 [Dentipellis sp. KUC8613]|nr:hypothetical protein DENSPDRAFT_568408 [Dentipellis sp. KUC8613]
MSCYNSSHLDHSQAQMRANHAFPDATEIVAKASGNIRLPPEFMSSSLTLHRYIRLQIPDSSSCLPSTMSTRRSKPHPGHTSRTTLQPSVSSATRLPTNAERMTWLDRGLGVDIGVYRDYVPTGRRAVSGASTSQAGQPSELQAIPGRNHKAAADDTFDTLQSLGHRLVAVDTVPKRIRLQDGTTDWFRGIVAIRSEEDFGCPIPGCGKRRKVSWELVLHFIARHLEAKYRCPVPPCDCVQGYWRNLKTHCKERHGDGTLADAVIPDAFMSREDYRKLMGQYGDRMACGMLGIIEL